MAHGNGQPALQDGDRQTFERLAWPIFRAGFVVGGVALVLALIVAAFVEHGGRRLAYAYLIAVAFALALSVGSMFFVLLTNLFRAGWCVVVRRVFEVYAANIAVVGVLLVPVLLVVAAEGGVLYGWNHSYKDLKAAAYHHDGPGHHDDHGHGPDKDDHGHEHGDHDRPHAAAGYALDVTHLAPEAEAADDHAADAGRHADHPHADHGHVDGHEVGSLHAGASAYYAYLKRPFLNRFFFLLRVIAFALLWSAIAWAFWRRSVRQDEDRDPEHSRWREKWAAPLTLICALTVTFGAFDLLMSLDPAFYSTIFGVYFFAGGFLLAMSWGVLTIHWLQGRGFLPSVTVEHYHDLGKLMFAFVFFWGYIAFSQYMLLWYANVPETAYWLEFHGLTTDDGSPYNGSMWTVLGVVLLFGHLLIPFLGLISRSEKRRLWTLCFWAGWLVVMCYLDLYWVVRPVLSFYGVEWGVSDGLLAVLCVVGVMGVFLAGAARRAAKASLVPLHDPRLDESLALRQI